MVVALASVYGLLIECAACTQSATGMPTAYAKALSTLGLLFGLALILTAAPWRSFTLERRRRAEAMVVVALALGGALLLGVVAGVYRPCPACVVVWSAVAVAALLLVGSGSRAATIALPLLVLAAAWTRYDRTTALGLTEILPQAELSGGCIADVLTRDDVKSLVARGVPSNGTALFVAHCSPCASATVKRLVEKTPGMRVVAPDATLSGLLGRDRLVVYPPLAARAATLGANVHRVTFHEGAITQCRSNLTQLD